MPLAYPQEELLDTSNNQNVSDGSSGDLRGIDLAMKYFKNAR